MLRTLAALLLTAGLACAAAPASTPPQRIAAGVTVAGVHVGGLTAEPARTRVARAFARPLRILAPDGVTTVEPARTGEAADVEAAVSAALGTTPRSSIAVRVRYSPRRIQAIVDALAARCDEAPVNAAVLGATTAGPVFSAGKDGRAVDRKALGSAIRRLLRRGARAPLALPVRRVPPARTAADFGPAIVVDRAGNTLRLYDGARLVRTFAVATGQAIYPTPAGIWRIVDKQRDPWWYPPTYDEWAKGLKPVPPGPGNPLGTRWMGLSAPGVGIHGTDAPASIGYSASHGCIRMQVPDAEWLFEHVRVGTPVVVL